MTPNLTSTPHSAFGGAGRSSIGGKLTHSLCLLHLRLPWFSRVCSFQLRPSAGFQLRALRWTPDFLGWLLLLVMNRRMMYNYLLLFCCTGTCLWTIRNHARESSQLLATLRFCLEPPPSAKVPNPHLLMHEGLLPRRRCLDHPTGVPNSLPLVLRWDTWSWPSMLCWFCLCWWDFWFG